MEQPLVRFLHKVVGVDLDHMLLRWSAVGEVVEEPGVVIHPHLHITPRARARMWVKADVEVGHQLAFAPKLGAEGLDASDSRIEVD